MYIRAFGLAFRGSFLTSSIKEERVKIRIQLRKLKNVQTVNLRKAKILANIKMDINKFNIEKNKIHPKARSGGG